MYSNLLYKNNSIEIINLNNYYSIKSINSIPSNTLLLLEHSLSSLTSINNIINIVNQNKDLYSFLCPREINYNNKNNNISINKVTSNIFQYNQLYILNKYISCLNHSCLCNCLILYTIINNNLNIPIVFMSVYSIRDINKDEELTIMYGVNIGHDENNKYHHFSCNCGLTKEERVEMSLKLKAMASSSSNKKYSAHRDIISLYCKNQLPSTSLPIPPPINSPSLPLPYEIIPVDPPESMKTIVITQLLALEAGVYKVSETEILPLERFHEYIAEHYQITSSSTDNERMNALYDILQKFDDKFEEFISNLTLDFTSSSEFELSHTSTSSESSEITTTTI